MTDLTDRERLAHVIDDAERMRTFAVRGVMADIDLLVDARHALTHGSPEVTAEFIERVLSSQRTLLATLSVPIGD